MNQLVYLGLGANIGDRESNLFTAIAALDVRAVSYTHLTLPTTPYV